MKVMLHDLTRETPEEIRYVAETIDDCRNDTERRVFELVNEFDGVITMGKIIGEPIRERRN